MITSDVILRPAGGVLYTSISDPNFICLLITQMTVHVFSLLYSTYFLA